jgi:acyl carrier protein
LAMHLEEHFGKVIAQRDIDKVQTVQDLAALLE